MRAIIVSSHLPINVKVTDGGVEVTHIEHFLTSLVASCDATWLGYPDSVIDVKFQAEVIAECAKINCIPVFLEEAQASALGKEGYCESILNPALYKKAMSDEYFCQSQTKGYEAYHEMNNKFVQAIAETMKEMNAEEICIWFHGVELMLAPQIIRFLLPNFRIGYSLHRSFKNSNGWEVITHAAHLIRSIFHSDLISVHTRLDKSILLQKAEFYLSDKQGGGLEKISDQFIETGGYRANASRIGESYFDGRGAELGICRVVNTPICLNTSYPRTNPMGELRAANLKRECSGNKIILGVDKLSYMGSIYRKLKGFQRFLSEHPVVAQGMIFVQVVICSGDISERKLEDRCQALVIDINGHNATCSFQFWRKSNCSPPQKVFVEFWDNENKGELLDLYKASSICLVTSLPTTFDGEAEEWLINNSFGILCLAESDALDRCLEAASVTFNPADSDQIAGALQRAIALSSEDRAELRQRGLSQLRKLSAKQWIQLFVEHLLTIPDYWTRPFGGRMSYALAVELIKTRITNSPPSTTVKPVIVILDLGRYIRQLELPRSDGVYRTRINLETSNIYPFARTKNALIVYLIDDTALFDNMFSTGKLPDHQSAILAPSRFWKTKDWDFDEVEVDLIGSRKLDKDCHIAVEAVKKFAEQFTSQVHILPLGNHAIIYYEDPLTLLGIYNCVSSRGDVACQLLPQKSLCIHPPKIKPSFSFIDELCECCLENLIILVGVECYKPAKNVIAFHSAESLLNEDLKNGGSTEQKIFMRSLIDAAASVREAISDQGRKI